MSVTVYLQQHGQAAVPLPGKVHQQPGAFLIVQHHAQVDTAPAQSGHPFQLVGSDADGIADVAHAACGKIFGFRQCGDRGRTGGAFHAATGDLPVLAGLEMGPQETPRSCRRRASRSILACSFHLPAAGRGVVSAASVVISSSLSGGGYRDAGAANVSGGKPSSHWRSRRAARAGSSVVQASSLRTGA